MQTILVYIMISSDIIYVILILNVTKGSSSPSTDSYDLNQKTWIHMIGMTM